MPTSREKILIVDEPRFSRICSAILEREGYCTEVVNDVRKLSTNLGRNDVGLVITSYPYGSDLFTRLKEMNIHTIIISDYMNGELMMVLEDLGKARADCMIMPLDYHQFRALVRQTMDQHEMRATS